MLALRGQRRRSASPATRCSPARSAASTRPGSTSFADLRARSWSALLALDDACVLNPGHVVALDGRAGSGRRTRSSACGAAMDAEGDEPCTALGKPATLVLWGDDYDGGYKAWVRWPDGRDDIVPGSRVERRAGARG